jgi:hypothetical protein
MFELRNKAFELRKSGLSYRAIQRELKVPLSTLSSWFAGEEWSANLGKKLRQEGAVLGATKLAQTRRARGFALQFSYAKAKQDAETEFKKFKKDPAFIAAVALYWASGDATSPYYCRFSTADPKKAGAFYALLTQFGDAPEQKVRCRLALSPTLQESSAVAQWHESSKIPLFCFTKSTFTRKPRNKSPKPWSVCTVTYSSRYMKEKMLVWTRLLAEELSSPAGQSVKKAK